MASVSASSVSFTTVSSSLRKNQVSQLKTVSVSFGGKSFKPSPLRLRIACAAKPETVDKVIEIVRKQLALPADSAIIGESKFSSLGADSLDTVEIVMGLEEEFGINVVEESAQTITTVQEAAEMIEKLKEKSVAA